MNKAHLLDENKRIAQVNNGQPPGRQTFEGETGIKSYHWKKFWPRWSEAVGEAGFSPNQYDNSYDEKELLKIYSRLAQELGKLRTQSDLVFKRHNDANLPAFSTFGRFGGKMELIKRVAEFCANQSEYKTVAKLCAEYVSPIQNVSEKTSHQEDGCVYLIKSGRFYKIGRANSAGRREYELSIQLPEKAKTIHVIRTDDPCGIEAYWHGRFALKRKNGEWFELSVEDIAIFKRRKFM